MPYRALVLVVAALVVVDACSSAGDRASRRGTATSAPSSTTPSAPSSSTTGSPTTVGVKLSQRYEPSLPVAIQEAAAASVHDRLYVVGGYDASENSSAAVFILDGTTWRRGPSLPIAVNHPGAAAIGTTVYVAGGFTANGATNRVFALAPGATSWRELMPMRRARGALALVALGGRLYAVGGRDGSAEIAVPEVYDETSQAWIDAPVMPAPRNHLAGYVDGASACVAGGRTPESSTAIDCFDPATATWRHVADLATATSGAAAATLNGVTLVAGGEPAGETRIVGVVQWWQRGTWKLTPMLLPRHGTSFAVFRGRLWACGGAVAPGFHAVAPCTSLALGS